MTFNIRGHYHFGATLLDIFNFGYLQNKKISSNFIEKSSGSSCEIKSVAEPVINNKEQVKAYNSPFFPTKILGSDTKRVDELSLPKQNEPLLRVNVSSKFLQFYGSRHETENNLSLRDDEESSSCSLD